MTYFHEHPKDIKLSEQLEIYLSKKINYFIIRRFIIKKLLYDSSITLTL